MHNTFLLVSPSFYSVAMAGGVPVQTLHDHRLLSPNVLLFCNRQICEDCLKKLISLARWCVAARAEAGRFRDLWPAFLVYTACPGTWTRMVHAYIALTEFSRRNFIEGGLPADKAVAHPDSRVSEGKGGHVVFDGWLTLD